MKRSVLWGLLAWVLVVAVASAVTWAVVDQAGQDVLSADAPAVTAPDFTSGLEAPGASPTPTRAEPSSSAARPSATGPSSPAGSEKIVEQSWQGEPGTLLVRCTGPVVALRSATPSDDYRVEVESRGPAEVEVKFEGGGGETTVKAECDAGVPRFRTEPDSPDVKQED